MINALASWQVHSDFLTCGDASTEPLDVVGEDRSYAAWRLLLPSHGVGCANRLPRSRSASGIASGVASKSSPPANGEPQLTTHREAVVPVRSQE